MSNILLITDNNNIEEKFCKRLVLLRSSDRISSCDYVDGPDVVYANRPDIAILHEHKDFDKTLGLIKYLKLQGCNVLLLIENYSRENILNAYDEGIDDYFSINSDPSELLIRTVNCIKKKNSVQKLDEYRRCLVKYGILSEDTGFYSKKCASEICDEELLLRDYSKGALTIITPVENEEAVEAERKLVEAIKTALRFNDFVVNAGGAKFCIINRESGADGAIAIINNIKSIIGGAFSIRAGVCEVKKYPYNVAEKKAQCALSDAMLSGQEVVVYSKKNSALADDWLDMPVVNTQNYRFFKQVFDKKLDSVITPVFYRMQMTYEEKLDGVIIEQYTDELQSIFRLTYNEHTSLLKLIYPGMTKINISLTHSGLDSPENEEVTIPVNKLTTANLTELMEKFIADFKTTME